MVPLSRLYLAQNCLESRCLASTLRKRASSLSSRLRMASERTALLTVMNWRRACSLSASVASGCPFTSHMSSCAACLCSTSSLVVESRPGVGRMRIFLVPRCLSAALSRAHWKLQSRMSAILLLSTLLASRALMMPPAWLIHLANWPRHARTHDQSSGGEGILLIFHTSLVARVGGFSGLSPHKVRKSGLWSESI